MKILRRTLLALLVLLIVGAVGGWFWFEDRFFTAPPNQLTVTEIGTPFPFSWGEHREGDLTVERAVLFAPVQVPGIDRPFRMQFDLGAPQSILYSKPLASLEEHGIALDRTTNEQGNAWIRDFAFAVGSTQVHAAALPVRSMGKSIDWSDTGTAPILGTLGADFIDGRVLTIDYPGGTLCLADTVPEPFLPEDLSPFSFRGRRVFLPARLDGEDTEVWFDTGSSAFQLITDASSYRELAAPGAEETTYTGNSWGTPVQIHDSPAQGTMEFAGTTVPLRKVSHIEWPNQLQSFLMSFSGMGGMCGNQMFVDRVLVLDAANQRFGVSG